MRIGVIAERKVVTTQRRAGLFLFYVRTLAEVFRPPRRPTAVVFFFVASVVHSFAHAGLALAAGWCAALLAGSISSGARLGSPGGARVALEFACLGLAAAAAKAGAGVLAAHEQATIASKVGGTLRMKVLDAWFASYPLRRPRHDDHGYPEAPPRPTPPATQARTAARGVSALTGRVTEVETGLAQGLLGGGRAVAQILPLGAALVWTAPKLALAAFAVLTPFAFLLSRSRSAWRRAQSQTARSSEELLEAADEAVRHADLWVSYSAEAKARAAVAHLGETLGRQASRIQASAAAMSGANEVLAAVALVCALGAGGAGWLGDVGDGRRLLAFTVCFFLAYRPPRELAEARMAWSRAAVAFHDLENLSPTHTSMAPDPAMSRLRAWPLEDLLVRRLVLSHGTTASISFVLHAGEVTVVVGPTGEGKTTLVRTLLGLETARSGEVRYGARSLVDAPPGLRARPFAWVPQDSALLADTIEANVLLGVPERATASDADADAVRSALESVGGGALLEAAGDGRLGPGGVAVSGGERQWIGLARALATTQPVLVLDEPTSGLDPASQDAVLQAVAGLRGVRSILLITHRAEPLALADTIVRFDGAEVRVEAGAMRTAQPPVAVTEA